MKTYQVHLTIADVTEVCAENEKEAEELAWEIFKENYKYMGNAEVDVEEVSEEEL